jgi:hypothetical protein
MLLFLDLLLFFSTPEAGEDTHEGGWCSLSEEYDRAGGKSPYPVQFHGQLCAPAAAATAASAAASSAAAAAAAATETAAQRWPAGRPASRSCNTFYNAGEPFQRL